MSLRRRMWSCLLGCLVTLGVTDGLADTWGPIDVEVDVGRLAVSHEETLQRDQAAMAVRNAEAGRRHTTLKRRLREAFGMGGAAFRPPVDGFSTGG